MASGYLKRRSALFAILACGLALLTLGHLPAGRGATLRRAVDPAVPPELQQMIARAADALNRRSPEEAARFTASGKPAPFAWAARASSRWTGDALAIPGTSPATETRGFLAVFHAWHTCESEADHVYRLVHQPDGWLIGDEIPEDETLGVRVRDHVLRVGLRKSDRTVSIEDTARIELTRAAGAFGLLRLSEDYTVESCAEIAAQGGHPVPFKQAGGIIAFAHPKGTHWSLRLAYRGAPAHTETDYFKPDEVSLESYWVPHTGRLPATSTVTVTAPVGWSAIAPGERIRQTAGPDGAETTTWRNELPISYYTLDAGRYRITERSWQGRTLAAYLLTGDGQMANRCLDLLQRAMPFYESHFGRYPYSRYAVVETRGEFPGALESYSFATFGPKTLPDLIPHELAHTWWGGIVGCTYTHSMWDEALAEYSDQIEAEANGHPPRAPDWAQLLEQRQNMASEYAVVPLASARDTNAEHEVAVGYDKGVRVMRALEAEIGQPALLRALKDIQTRWPHGDPAEWPDLQAAIEKSSGRNLKWFFEQWLHRTGVPLVGIANVSIQRAGDRWAIAGDVMQEAPFYRLRIPVSAEGNRGTSAQVIVECTGERTPFRLLCDDPPVRVRLDPKETLPFAPSARWKSGDDPTVVTLDRTAVR